jgi:hypothetical protein
MDGSALIGGKMAIRGRVGRHTRAGGRQCQNWSDDQKTVIDLLNLIPLSAGGSEGHLNARIVGGIASDELYGAISRFEDKHFPGRRRGYVDPGGDLLKQLEKLALQRTSPIASPVKPPPKQTVNHLFTLRKNISDTSRWIGLTAGQLVDFDPLIHMALKHVDSMIDQGFTKLAWPVELLGRVYITKNMKPERDLNSGAVEWTNELTGEEENPLKYRNLLVSRSDSRPLPEMSYFHPVDLGMDITTRHLSALLLFNESFGNACARVLPYRHGSIQAIGDYLRDPNLKGLRMPAYAYDLGDLAAQIDTDNYIQDRETDEINRQTEAIKRETEAIKRRTSQLRSM